MKILEQIKSWNRYDFTGAAAKMTGRDVEHALSAERVDEQGLLALLSPAARDYFEPMAVKARDITLRHFGRTIQLYIPLYLANYCSNSCTYCGFSAKNKIGRSKLTMDEIEGNAAEIAKTGMKHILILTGESRAESPPEYIIDAVKILRKYFVSVSIEVYPMETDEYRMLKDAGVDGLTIYQETYDPGVYSEVHPAGKKRDYAYRLGTPARGAEAGFRWVNIGALYGLAEPAKESFMSALHAKYLQNKYIDTEISLSLPRMNEAEGGYHAKYTLDDRDYVKTMLAFRIFLPRAGITLSTRERAEFRDRLLPLGITRISAGSMTTVGGYDVQSADVPQFEVSDCRSVDEVVKAIAENGYEPVFQDWVAI
ncbi:MAG: thiamine biosynthesis protein ThiH [Spirochaetes bacterium GWF1_51_8]|nr:MAG: thiamine biosynthesis protein ThiH [Spirochaetes bacterium GWF1_51_8]